ncbi:hypothetical protein GOP47_0014779 [Adiantum capillus-veneris]|uniref:Cytochrome P450 n=1 Tax=Adiantum capillus-veneris TaxID=13818 RepID=A0A9D4ZF50_ADICA|nr:hypothetical protein GOP47_0014779 [Adiantum capillus-veneris]
MGSFSLSTSVGKHRFRGIGEVETNSTNCWEVGLGLPPGLLQAGSSNNWATVRYIAHRNAQCVSFNRKHAFFEHAKESYGMVVVLLQANDRVVWNGVRMMGACDSMQRLAWKMVCNGLRMMGACDRKGYKCVSPHVLGILRATNDGDGGFQLLWWALALISCLATWLLASLLKNALLGRSKHFPPVVPGVPVLGNLLQLGEKRPHKTFTTWAEKHGPIYTIKMGSETMVVISSPELAKEAMITKFSSISTRKMTKALSILTAQKTMVAMSDYGAEHRMLKKLVVTNLLGQTPQKANRKLRERAFYQLVDNIFDELKKQEGIINVREHVKRMLFPFALHQVLGRDPDFVFVEEWGRNVSRWEIFQSLVMDPLEAVIEVDWRDFFPALKWVPNKVEEKIWAVNSKRKAIVSALVSEQRKLLANGKAPDCYLDILLTEATHLTETQLVMSAWEPIIESADTTLVTIEWAMYELAKHPMVQERLFEEIKDVARSRLVTEEDLPALKYLDAIVKETLRIYPPVSLLPPRHVDEDVKLGGFDVKKGWQILINVYGINHSKKIWVEPEVWNPERVLKDASLDLGVKDHRILPFGTGKRYCAGVTQAMYIVPMAIAYLVQHFKWALSPEEAGKGVVDTVYLTTHKLYPLEALTTARVDSRLPSL